MLVRLLSYFKNNFQLIALDLSRQKACGTDPMAIQQIEFNGDSKTNSQTCTILKKSKETILEFHKGVAKVLESECVNDTI